MTKPNKHIIKAFNDGIEYALREILERIEIMGFNKIGAAEQLEHITTRTTRALLEHNWRILNEEHSIDENTEANDNK